VSGPRAVQDLLAVWLRGLPLHESRALNDLALALAFAKQKAESLPPTIDRRCADLINTKLDEAEHWSLAALRAAVDRSDIEGLGVRWCPHMVGACTRDCGIGPCLKQTGYSAP
jgi:hypothetical protein